MSGEADTAHSFLQSSALALYALVSLLETLECFSLVLTRDSTATNYGMGKHFALLHPETARAYIIVCCSQPVGCVEEVCSNSHLGLLRRQRGLHNLHSPDQTLSTLPVSPRVQPRHHHVSTLRRPPHFYRPLGYCLHLHGLVSLLPDQGLVACPSRCQVLRFWVAQPPYFRSNVREPYGRQHGPRRACPGSAGTNVF